MSWNPDKLGLNIKLTNDNHTARQKISADFGRQLSQQHLDSGMTYYEIEVGVTK
jgi:hypothetical protein